MEPPATGSSRSFKKSVLLIAISAFLAGAFYLGVALVVGLEDVRSAWREAGPPCVFAALLASVFSITVRSLRWQLYLRVLGYRLPFRVNFPIYVAGLSLTTVPGKLGEMIRSFFLRPHGVPYASSVAAFFADRLSDLLGVLLVASLLAWLVYPPARLLTVFAVLLALALAAFRVAYLPVAGRLLGCAPRSWRIEAKLSALTSMFERLRTCLSPSVFALGVATGALAYSSQGLALAFIVQSMGGHVPAEAAILSFLLSTLGGAAAMLPAGLGGMEAALVALLSWFGFPVTLAVAATILIRLATLWFVVVLGLCSLVWVQLRDSGRQGAQSGAQS